MCMCVRVCARARAYDTYEFACGSVIVFAEYVRLVME